MFHIFHFMKSDMVFEISREFLQDYKNKYARLNAWKTTENCKGRVSG